MRRVHCRPCERLLVGWEAAIILRHIRGLMPAASINISVAAARALVERALADAGGQTG